jgi:hypothetical protein
MYVSDMIGLADFEHEATDQATITLFDLKPVPWRSMELKQSLQGKLYHNLINVKS